MATPLQSLIASGTKLWLDSVDPELVKVNRSLGATGATSNPIIVANLVKSGRFDSRLGQLAEKGADDEAIAWGMTDHLVRTAQEVFAEVWHETAGNDGYVSFEVDPLLEDAANTLSHDQRVARYIELGQHWSTGHSNRMIKVPATAAGLDALESLAAAGVPLNVTLIFTPRQYEIARENIWRGAQQRSDGLTRFKSVYSIFISRVDVYTAKHLPQLSSAAQGQVGIVNVKRIWQSNEAYWQEKGTPLQQEIVFASTGVKSEGEPADKYVEALAGSGIQTNPPETNEAVENMGKTYRRSVDQMPDSAVLEEIDREVDLAKLEEVLMAEGVAKFADPHKALIEMIAERRRELAGA